ncbi:T-cell receptor gamma chain C region C10.5 [Marmota flaviventris]|uniref:T-cell receptor gamma chain C region C10.5 n=1 Tax=Marmota flaviventris TaxID=93162 RepID=UPI003A8961EF
MPLLKAVILSSLWAFVLGELEQPEISISREKDKSARMSCKAILQSFNSIDIHWYREKPNQGLEHLIYVRTKYNQRTLGGKNKKFEASKDSPTSTSVLTVNFLGKEDEATYYCACWTSNFEKVFGSGTKLVVTDKIFNADIYPKPTIFLPSVAETNLHNAGTYLCLLENFFPDVIKVYWKENGGYRILESHQGNTMKTKDTYMKMSWLTVTGESMDKEHKCIVKHENNKRGVDQEILFPAIRKVVTTMNPREADLKVTNAVTTINARKADLKCESVVNTTESEAYLKDALKLQLTNTSVYWTYLLLLLKSVVYLAFVTFSLLRKTAVGRNGKST